MASFASIATGIETNLATISGLRVYDIFDGQFGLPAAIVDLPETIDYDLTFSRNADTWNVKVVLLVSKASERAGRKKLYEYLASTGATSIKTAIESDKTLGGAADTVQVTTAELMGQYVVSDIAYIGATFNVEVVA